ncbi:MAG: hypothetical protein ABH879_07470 [archaeon]
MKYKGKGYNRLLVGNLYSWELDRFENAIFWGSYENQAAGL